MGLDYNCALKSGYSIIINLFYFVFDLQKVFIAD